MIIVGKCWKHFPIILGEKLELLLLYIVKNGGFEFGFNLWKENQSC